MGKSTSAAHWEVTSSTITWQTSRVWGHPPVCGLLAAVVTAKPAKGIMFELQLSAAHMAHVWDYVVGGRALVPGVLFMEIATCSVQ